MKENTPPAETTPSSGAEEQPQSTTESAQSSNAVYYIVGVILLLALASFWYYTRYVRTILVGPYAARYGQFGDTAVVIMNGMKTIPVGNFNIEIHDVKGTGSNMGMDGVSVKADLEPMPNGGRLDNVSIENVDIGWGNYKNAIKVPKRSGAIIASQDLYVYLVAKGSNEESKMQRIGDSFIAYKIPS